MILRIGSQLASLYSERIESLKVGAIAALSFSVAYGLVLVCRLLWLELAIAPLAVPTGTELLVKGGLAWLSGFLFGVTYRYTVSNNQNPFLRDGVVLAFALVRGLAPVEVLSDWSQSSVLIILVVESLFCFAIARFTLERVFEF